MTGQLGQHGRLLLKVLLNGLMGKTNVRLRLRHFHHLGSICYGPRKALIRRIEHLFLLMILKLGQLISLLMRRLLSQKRLLLLMKLLQKLKLNLVVRRL